MIDVLVRPKIPQPAPVEALPEPDVEEEPIEETWAALERSVGYERLSGPAPVGN